MPIVSHPEAAEELVGAALWYEERQPGLGDDFLEAFEHTLRRIEAEPERWPTIRGDIRKLNLRCFPYALVYSIGPDAIHLKPVMHLSNSCSARSGPLGTDEVLRDVTEGGFPPAAESGAGPYRRGTTPPLRWPGSTRDSKNPHDSPAMDEP